MPVPWAGEGRRRREERGRDGDEKDSDAHRLTSMWRKLMS
jgi:hypothetical protein